MPKSPVWQHTKTPKSRANQIEPEQEQAQPGKIGKRGVFIESPYGLWLIASEVDKKTYTPFDLEWARVESGELTYGWDSQGDFKVLPDYTNPRIIGIPTISFQYIKTLLSKK